MSLLTSMGGGRSGRKDEIYEIYMKIPRKWVAISSRIAWIFQVFVGGKVV